MSIKLRWDCVAAQEQSFEEYERTRKMNFNVESPAVVEAFLADIFAVCRKHQLTIAHEDSHGEFLIEEFQEDNIAWLDDASLNIKAGE